MGEVMNRAWNRMTPMKQFLILAFLMDAPPTNMAAAAKVSRPR